MDKGQSHTETTDRMHPFYDVFLSFRGLDTRKGFTDHLYHSLVKVGIVSICVFRDDRSISIGEEFGSQILDAITRSKISIPIISKNYASSKWCLRELIHIMDYKKRTSHIVLPIFYKVDPSDVRYLKGSFGEAFQLRKQRFDENDIQEGIRALREVSGLRGWESKKFANGHEGQLIEHVVETIIKELQKYFQLYVPKQLVGLDGRMKEIMNWINNPSINAQMIGIYGMGGIGKTTLAKCIYNQLSNKFVHVSFLPDVRETTKRRSIVYLQSQLISDILNEKNEVSRIDDGINIIKSKFRQKKVLILLDDIDDKNQLDALVRKHDWFMGGSLIIVTTRNKAVLDQSEFEVDYMYELNGLDEVQALLLFNRHAFRMDHSPREFEGISRDIISTMGGLPLALQVVGSYLYRKMNQKVWEDVWKQLKNQPHRDVQKILQISYDALEDGHKQIFLDIACFLLGEYSKFAMYMWEDCGLYPDQGIEELKLRCLIKIGDDGDFMMHDQLRDLGRSIFCREQSFEKRSGPWDDSYEGVPRILKHQGGLFSLYFLRVAPSKDSMEPFFEVRWLQWMVWAGRLSLFTINVHLPNLSVLELSGDRITEDWQGWISFMASKQLKVLNINACYCLRCIPDLSAFTQLKILNVIECVRLKCLHPSIGKLASLISLNLCCSPCLKEVPEEVGELKDLEELLLDDSGITEIPTFIGSLRKLEKLSASCKSLREIPSSIGDLQNLRHLDLHGSAIEELPSAIGRLKNLQTLDLSSCDSLKVGIPSEIGDLPSLEDLALSKTPISNLPSVRNLSSLQRLDLLLCTNLRSLPELPSSLHHLELKGCEKFRLLLELPSSLWHLDLGGCHNLRSLPELPSSLRHLDLGGCHNLQSLSELPFSLQHLDLGELPPSLQHLDLCGCHNLWLLPEFPSSLQHLNLGDCNNLQSLPELPSSLQHLDLRGCKELRSLPELPSSLQHLDIWGCHNLRSLPKLPSLQHLDLRGCHNLRSLSELPSSLQHLDLWGCHNLRSLPELPSSLQHLVLRDCEKFRSLPKLPSSLQHLDLWGCHNLRSLPELPSSLQHLELRGCEKFGLLPKLPSSLQHLDLGGCHNLWSLPELPSSLQHLDLGGCHYLQLLPELPSSLQHLDLRGCHNLRSLPELLSLQHLDLRGCHDLRSLPELPSSL